MSPGGTFIPCTRGFTDQRPHGQGHRRLHPLHTGVHRRVGPRPRGGRASSPAHGGSPRVVAGVRHRYLHPLHTGVHHEKRRSASGLCLRPLRVGVHRLVLSCQTVRSFNPCAWGFTVAGGGPHPGPDHFIPCTRGFTDRSPSTGTSSGPFIPCTRGFTAPPEPPRATPPLHPLHTGVHRCCTPPSSRSALLPRTRGFATPRRGFASGNGIAGLVQRDPALGLVDGSRACRTSFVLDNGQG